MSQTAKEDDVPMIGSTGMGSSYQPTPASTQTTAPFNNTPPGYAPAPGQWPAAGTVPATQQPPNMAQQSNNNVVVVQQPGYSYAVAPPRPDDYLGLAIFALLCCCWPIAIPALVNSCQVGDRYSAGDYAGAVHASERAKFWSKVSIIVGSVISIVLVIVFVVIPIIFTVGVAGAGAAASS